MSEQPFDPEAEGVYEAQDEHQKMWEDFRDDCLLPMLAAIEGGESALDYKSAVIKEKIATYAYLLRGDIDHVDTLADLNKAHKDLFRPQPEEMIVVDPTVSDVGPEEDSA